MTYNPNDITATFAYIWRPGGTTLGNVLAFWSEVQAVIASHSGTVLIFVDNSLAPATVPVGTTDCQNRVVFTSAFQHELPSEVKMILPDGAVLHDVRGIEGFLTVQTQATTTPNFTFTNDRALGLNDGGIIENVGTQPAIRIAPGGFFVITFAESSIFVNTVAGAGPLVDLGLGATAVLYTITGGGYTTDNTVTSAGASVAQFQFDASLANFPANPGFAGTTQKFVLDDAQFVAYEPAVPANWPVPPTQVAQALDELAAEINGGTPETMAYFNTAGKLTGTPAFITVNEAGGFVFFNATASDNGSSARIQNTSLVANGSQFRSNQYGNNAGTPGLSTFKSRGLTIGSLVGLLAGDPISRWTTVGVAPDNASIPLSSFVTIQVPANFVPAGQNWLPSELEVQLVPLAGPINGRRVSFKITSEGETQTLRGIRAGGPATLPANLTTGTLWSSENVTPNGTIVGSPGDIFSDTIGGTGATLWVKETGVATNAGWVPFSSGVTQFGAIIYKPGTPSAGDHVATWPEVQTFITQTDGKCIVYVDDSIVSPALVPGATGVTECFGRVELRPFATDALLFTVLQIEPGATLNNLWALTAMELRCNPQTATPSLDFTLTAGGGYLAITQFGALTNATTATTPAISLATGKQFYIDLEQGIFAAFNAGFVNFTVPFVAMAGMAEVFINAYDGSLIGANFASGTGSIDFFYDTPTAGEFRPTPGTASTVPAFTGVYSTSNIDHPLTTEWGTQATWFIDPQNVTGLADDQNSGIDLTHPVQSYNGGIVQKWGSVSPTLKQNTTITWLSSQLDASDPVVFTPSVSNSVTVLNATFGASQIIHSGALVSVTPKNRVTPQLLQADLGFAAPIGSIVQNTTRGSSLAEVYQLIAGTTFALTQPLTPLTAPVDITAAQGVTEVDTWANGDTFNVLTPISVNIVKIAPLTTEYQDSPLFFPASVQLQHLNFTMPTPGTNTTTAFIGDDVSIFDCSSDASIGDTSTGDDLATFFINVFMSNSVFSTIGSNISRFVYGGAVIASAEAGPTTFAGLFDLDAIIDATGAAKFFIELDQTTGFNHQGLVYITGLIQLGGIVAFLPTSNVSNATTLWGPGTLDTVGSARVVYGAGAGAAVATFLNTGGMKLNGQASANGFDPGSALWSILTPITPANLDLAFGSGGFGGLALNLGGSSYTNQATP